MPQVFRPGNTSTNWFLIFYAGLCLFALAYFMVYHQDAAPFLPPRPSVVLDSLKARVIVADTLIFTTDRDSVVLSSAPLFFRRPAYEEQQTSPMRVEMDFLQQLKTELGPTALSKFPTIEYEVRGVDGRRDWSRYEYLEAPIVVRVGDSGWHPVKLKNRVVIASGKRSDFYALFVLKHELGHWAHFHLMSEEFASQLRGEFTDDQHIATFLGYELEKFLRGERTVLDSLLTR